MDNKIISNIKALGIDMIDAAGSGHPGIVLGAAPILYTLYARHMNVNTNDPKWINRDRFVLSAGHGSALLYATLYMAGFDISLDDLKKFRRAGYKTPGHPEINVTPGVDMSTGPLGQGIATAVGMALGEKISEEKFYLEEKKKSLINYNVYVLCGDGDLMEGISYEAISLAGTLNLDNLIVLYDSNNISLDGDTSNTFVENVCDRFKSMGWHTEQVKNGKCVDDIDQAINRAKKSGKPSLIEVRTIIGNGSMMAGTNTVHGKCLEKDDIELLKTSLELPNQAFYEDNESKVAFQKMISERSNHKYELWSRGYNEYTANTNNVPLDYLMKDDLNIDLNKYIWQFSKDNKISPREANGEIMNVFAKDIPNFIGGSADLSSSTKTYIHGFSDVKDEHYNGRNIWFGVREHSMGAILNGLSLSGYRVFGSTFLAFADYMKPAIRLSAIMGLPVTYIFTHDSINIGQDGPTHQPIEQLAMLRSTPNLRVYRPSDSKEIVGCWTSILKDKTHPSVLVLSRADSELLPNSNSNFVSYGAYIVKPEVARINGIIIATGSEVHTAITIANDLYINEQIDIRVVSMPSMELFLEQTEEYKNKLFPMGYKKIVIEAGSSFGWHQFVYNEKYLMTIDKFGVSGTKKEVESHCNFSYEEIKDRIKKLLK